SDLVPQGAVKKQLTNLETALHNALAAIKKIPDEWGDELFQEIEPNLFVRQLRQVHQASKKLADTVHVKRSGGAARSRENGKRARIAAGCAFDLLNDWGHV